MTRRILVIKLGALGDVVQAFPAFAAIRAHHPGATIAALTTPPFAALLRRAPWFDEVHDEGRPDWTDLPALARLTRLLATGRFDRVYDLQTSGRSSRYRLLVGPRAEWSGIAPGASHRQIGPGRETMHTADRLRDQLRIAGIAGMPAPDLSWLDADLSAFALPDRFALLIPGASAHRPGKRWPHFPALAAALPFPPVVVGVAAETPLARDIAAADPRALDLTGRSTIPQLAALARRAAVAVGNDTGPPHRAAIAGCPTLALFGGESDPRLTAPRGPAVRVLRADPIAAILPAEASAAALALARLPP